MVKKSHSYVADYKRLVHLGAELAGLGPIIAMAVNLELDRTAPRR